MRRETICLLYFRSRWNGKEFEFSPLQFSVCKLSCTIQKSMAKLRRLENFRFLFFDILFTWKIAISNKIGMQQNKWTVLNTSKISIVNSHRLRRIRYFKFQQLSLFFNGPFDRYRAAREKKITDSRTNTNKSKNYASHAIDIICCTLQKFNHLFDWNENIFIICCFFLAHIWMTMIVVDPFFSPTYFIYSI